MVEDWNRVIEVYKKQLKELMDVKPCYYKAIKKREIPSVSGVYAIFDKAEVLLYVGQSSRLRGRLINDHLKNDKAGSAFRRNLSECYHLNTEKEITQYVLDNCFFKYMELDTPKFLEHFAISLLKPKLNK